MMKNFSLISSIFFLFEFNLKKNKVSLCLRVPRNIKMDYKIKKIINEIKIFDNQIIKQFIEVIILSSI